MTPPPGDRLPGCTFCDIVAHDVATDLVLDESSMVAFLDRRPVFPGHVLVVPRLHFETLVDLPLRLVEPLFATTRRVAGAVARAMEADGSLVAIGGISSINSNSKSVAKVETGELALPIRRWCRLTVRRLNA